MEALDFKLHQNTVFDTFDLVYSIIKKRAAEVSVSAEMEKFLQQFRYVIRRILKQSLNVPEMYRLLHSFKVGILVDFVYFELESAYLEQLNEFGKKQEPSDI
jgi:hypothetical protein